MIKLTVYCDKPGCNVSQEVYFGSEKETFKDFLDHIKSNGWKIDGGPDQKSFEITCMHSHENE